MDAALLRILGPQLPLPQLIKQRFHGGRGKLRRPEATALLHPTTPKVGMSFREKHTIVSTHNSRAVAQKFSLGER